MNRDRRGSDELLLRLHGPAFPRRKSVGIRVHLCPMISFRNGEELVLSSTENTELFFSVSSVVKEPYEGIRTFGRWEVASAIISSGYS